MARYLIFIFIFWGSLCAGSIPVNSTVALIFNETLKDSKESEALISALEAKLYQTQKLRLVERSQVKQILQEQGFQQSGACDASECQVEMGRLLGVAYLIDVNFSNLSSQWVANLKVLNVETGEMAAVIEPIVANSLDSMLTMGLGQITHSLQMVAFPSYADSVKQSNRLAQEQAAQVALETQQKLDRERKIKNQRKKMWGWVAIGLGAISSGVGYYKMSQSEDAYQRAEELYPSYTQAQTTPAADNQRKLVEEELDAGDSHKMNGLILYGLGGVSLTTGIVLLTF